ncbi:MAG: MFS transporter [Steroidobacteraceae bacterium]
MRPCSASGAADPRALIALLAVCGALGPVATNLFLPALPLIREQFAVTVAATQTTVSSFLVAYAFATLFTGPIAERFGRRPTILSGAAIFTMGSALCALASSLPALIAGRVVQALGAAATLTGSRTVVADVFSDQMLPRMIATLTMTMVIATVLTPWAGGYIAAAFGWKAGFWMLLLAGTLLLVVALRRLPETRPGAGAGHRIVAILLRSRRALAEREFVVTLCQASAIYAIFLVLIAYAPYLMRDVYGGALADVGRYYILMSLGYFVGNWLISRGRIKADVRKVLRIALLIQLLGALASLAVALAPPGRPIWLFAPLLPMAFGQGLALPHLSARAVSPAPGFAGLASSLLGFAQQATAAAAVQGMGFARTDTAVPVMLFCVAVSGLAMLALLFTPRSRAARLA